MKIRFKKLCPEATVPTRAHQTDAGYDLTATDFHYDECGNIVYHTGIAVEIPKGFCGLLFPRSSIHKCQLLLSNSVGIIDSGYRGEIMLKFKPSLALDENRHVTGACMYGIYIIGQRIGQLVIMPVPEIEFEEADSLTDSDRGEGGYGSSGR